MFARCCSLVDQGRLSDDATGKTLLAGLNYLVGGITLMPWQAIDVDDIV